MYIFLIASPHWSGERADLRVEEVLYLHHTLPQTLNVRPIPTSNFQPVDRVHNLIVSKRRRPHRCLKSSIDVMFQLLAELLTEQAWTYIHVATIPARH